MHSIILSHVIPIFSSSDGITFQRGLAMELVWGGGGDGLLYRNLTAMAWANDPLTLLYLQDALVDG